jgi:hypothetical protein
LEPETFGVLDGLDVGPLGGDEPGGPDGEPLRTLGVEVPEGPPRDEEGDEDGDEGLPLTFGVEFLPRSFPALRTVEAFDWSVERAAAAVSLTF